MNSRLPVNPCGFASCGKIRRVQNRRRSGLSNSKHIDIPSGLMGEENTFNVKANIIRADVTFSLQLPKLAFLFAENTEFVYGEKNYPSVK